MGIFLHEKLYAALITDMANKCQRVILIFQRFNSFLSPVKVSRKTTQEQKKKVFFCYIYAKKKIQFEYQFIFKNYFYKFNMVTKSREDEK